MEDVFYSKSNPNLVQPTVDKMFLDIHKVDEDVLIFSEYILYRYQNKHKNNEKIINNNLNTNTNNDLTDYNADTNTTNSYNDTNNYQQEQYLPNDTMNMMNMSVKEDDWIR